MKDKILGELQSEEFDNLIDSYIDRHEPDTMSFEAFDQATQQLAEDAIAETIELTGTIENNEIVFDAADSMPIIAHGNEVLIGGLRIVIRLRQADPMVTAN